MEPRTWQGLGGDRQGLEMTGLAGRFLPSGFFIAAPSCLLPPSPSVPTPSIKVIRYCPPTSAPRPRKEHIALLPGSQRHSLEECIGCQKWDSAGVLPSTVSGTLGTSPLLSVFPNAQGRGRLDQGFSKGDLWTPWKSPRSFQGLTRAELFP